MLVYIFVCRNLKKLLNYLYLADVATKLFLKCHKFNCIYLLFCCHSTSNSKQQAAATTKEKSENTRINQIKAEKSETANASATITKQRHPVNSELRWTTTTTAAAHRKLNKPIAIIACWALWFTHVYTYVCVRISQRNEWSRPYFDRVGTSACC